MADIRSIKNHRANVSTIYYRSWRIKIMRLALPSLLFAVLLFSCHNINVNIQEHRSTIIVDSMKIADTTGLQANFLISSYKFYYLGELQDTIRLEKEPLSDYWEQENDKERLLSYASADANNLSIFVDTTTVFSSSRLRFYQEPADSSPVKSYGIFVRNLSDEAIYLGSFNDLDAVQQVQTPDGQWFNIEIPPMYFCGTGSRVLSLNCNDIGIAKFRIGNGKIKVKTRLCMERTGRSIYSNEFYDRVDSIPTRHFTQEMFQEWLEKKYPN